MLIGPDYEKKFRNTWNDWLNVKYRGINYGNLVANELACFCHYDDKSNQHYSVNEGLKQLFKAFLFTTNQLPYVIPTIDASKNILYLNEEDGRTDYQNQCKFVLEQLKDLSLQEIYINKINTSGKRFKISIKNSFSKVCLSVKLVLNINLIKKYFDYNNKGKILYLYRSALIYHDLAVYLESSINWAQIKLLITFSDMKQYSNLITQIAKSNGVKTATQQHAIYIKFNNSNYSQPAINYENYISDYLLAWGDSIKKQWAATGINDACYRIAGSNVLENHRKLKNMVQNLPEENNFGIILSSEYWKQSNIAMLKLSLKLSKEHEIKFEILFHPTNNIAAYLTEIPELNSIKYYQGIPDFSIFILKQRFLICHTTTLYITSLVNLRKCFRFKDIDFIDIGGLKDMFSSYSELNTFYLKGFKLTNSDTLEINNLLEYHFGNESDNYKKEVLNIINE